MFYAKSKVLKVAKEDALPGREVPISVGADHFVNGAPLKGPYPPFAQIVYFGLGCFWGAERLLWQVDGVFVTAVGYGAGYTPNPTYEEVCTGQTGHNELVMVVYEPEKVSLEHLFMVFFEAHDPTQGMRQGNDIGTQYRSGIYVTNDEQMEIAVAGIARYEAALKGRGFSNVTTELLRDVEFYFAETYHQQYLAKNPGGYCGLRGTSVAYCVGSDPIEVKQ